MPKIVFFTMLLTAILNHLFAKSMEVTPLTGKNFTDRNEAIKDSFYFGVRLNQYLYKTSGIRLGFDEIISADFKSAYQSKGKSTNISRYFLEASHDFRFGKSPLVPYIFGGFGYEKVSKELYDDEFSSQTFADAGAGMKFYINEKYSIATEASAIKKIYENRLNYTVSMAIGYKLNNPLLDPAPAKPINHIRKKTSYTTGSFYKKKKNQIKKKQAPTIQTAIEKIKPKLIKMEDQNTTIKTAQKVTKPKAVTIDKHKNTRLSKGVYFIQMAAAFRTSIQKGEEKIINKLKNMNEPYEIKELTLKSVPLQRLLAGPYDSFKKAKSKLKELKKINQKAFIRYIK